MSDANQRTAKPGDLLSQWWTLGAIATDRRTSGRHMKAGWVIINSYWKKHGNGRASLRYIENATGMKRTTVVKACRELDEWGHVTRVLGAGSRPSEYMPNWVTSVSGAKMGTTNDSGPQTGTGAVPEQAPLATSSGAQTGTESYLPEPAYDRLQVGNVSASGPGAEAPAEAGIGFERIWRAYGRYGNKQASKRAFEAIATPDADHIAGRASAWAASAKPGQRRMPLEKWLAAEKYDEADRSVRPRAKPLRPDEYPDEYQDEGDDVPKRTSATASTEIAEYARKIQRSAIEIDVPRGVPLTVMASAVESRDGDKWLEMQTDHGRVAVLLEGYNEALQRAGQAHFNLLTAACGLGEVNDSGDLHGKPFMVVGDTFAAVSTEPA